MSGELVKATTQPTHYINPIARPKSRTLHTKKRTYPFVITSTILIGLAFYIKKTTSASETTPPPIHNAQEVKAKATNENGNMPFATALGFVAIACAALAIYQWKEQNEFQKGLQNLKDLDLELSQLLPISPQSASEDENPSSRTQSEDSAPPVPLQTATTHA